MTQDRMFTWDAWEDSMIFPIDYTSRESAKKFHQEPRSFRERVLKHYLFRDILQSLAIPTDSASKLLKTMPPIPVEAILFLDCFYQLAQQTDHDFRKTIYRKKENIPPEDMDRFLNEFCDGLYKRVAPPQADEEQDIYAFCRHIFFQNETFRSTLLNSIWQQQIAPRYEQLQELAKQAPFEDQLLALKDCLISLDRTILNLRLKVESSAGQTSAPNQRDVAKQEPMLRQMLKDLLSMRKRNDQASKKDRSCGDTARKPFSYKVPDIKIDGQTTLEDIFLALEQRSGRPSKGMDSLLANGRYAYLKYLSGVIESRNDTKTTKAYTFEKQYIDLQNYLAVPSMSSEDIEGVVRTSLKQYCQQILAYCTYTQLSDEYVQAKSWSALNHSDNLLESLVQTRANQALNLFWDKIQLVAYYSAGIHTVNTYWLYNRGFLQGNPKLKNIYDTVQNITPKMIGNNIPYQEALSFCIVFQELWDFLYPDHAPLFNEETHNFLEPDDIAATLYRDGRVAAHFFEMDDLALSSVREAQTILNSYKLIMDNPCRILPPTVFWTSIPQILSNLLLLIMQKIVKDNVPKLVKFFQPLGAIQPDETTSSNLTQE